MQARSSSKRRAGSTKRSYGATGPGSAAESARELPNLPLEDALQLVKLYAEKESPKYEKAAMRWLERYLAESSPRLQHFAEITARLVQLGPVDR